MACFKYVFIKKRIDVSVQTELWPPNSDMHLNKTDTFNTLQNIHEQRKEKPVTKWTAINCPWVWAPVLGWVLSCSEVCVQREGGRSVWWSYTFIRNAGRVIWEGWSWEYRSSVSIHKGNCVTHVWHNCELTHNAVCHHVRTNTLPDHHLSQTPSLIYQNHIRTFSEQMTRSDWTGSERCGWCWVGMSG